MKYRKRDEGRIEGLLGTEGARVIEFHDAFMYKREWLRAGGSRVTAKAAAASKVLPGNASGCCCFCCYATSTVVLTRAFVRKAEATAARGMATWATPFDPPRD